MAQCTIGPGIVVHGRITGAATVTVSGRVEGAVVLDDELIVAPDGVVIGEVDAECVSVLGTFEGTLSAHDTIQICDGSSVTADVFAPRIIIEQGARFAGNLDMDVSLPNT